MLEEFYEALRQYLQSWTVTPLIEKVGRKKIARLANTFVLKDNQLYYTGPSRIYMRLAVSSDKLKHEVLQACHVNPVTGSHHGHRRTRDRVNAGYYWPTINGDIENWIKNCDQCQSTLNKTSGPALLSNKFLKRKQSRASKPISD